MTKDEIIAELRRSACEDADPKYDAHPAAIAALWDYRDWNAWPFPEPANTYRNWFLLVAEALS